MSNSVQPHRRQTTRLPRPWDSPGKNTGVGCHFLLQCRKVKSESEVAQSCPTPSDPMDCILPGSSIHGIFQAKVLEWGAIAFSKRKTLKSSKRRPCRSSDHNLRTIPSLWFSTYFPLERRCEFPNRLFCCCSVTQLCSTLCDPMDCSMPGFPVLCYLLEFAQTQVHWISDAIQPSHPLSSPSSPALNLSQNQDLSQ